jgi:hypothetical protein
MIPAAYDLLHELIGLSSLCDRLGRRDLLLHSLRLCGFQFSRGVPNFLNWTAHHLTYPSSDLISGPQSILGGDAPAWQCGRVQESAKHESQPPALLFQCESIKRPHIM